MIFNFPLRLVLMNDNRNDRSKRYLQPRRRRRVQAFVLSLLTAGILATSFIPSCSPKTYTGQVATITIGNPGMETSALIFIAEDQHFFAQNGIHIINKYYETGVSALNAMINGEVDISVPVGEYALAGKVLTKEKIQTIGSIDKANYQSITGRTDRGILAPSDLKGKKIGVILGTQQQYYISLFLEMNGIQTKGVSLVNITLSESVDAIVNGEIDAVVTPPPYTDSIMEKLGSGAVSWSVQSKQLTQQLMVGRNEWIIQHPELIKRFIKALAEAQDYLFQHADEAKNIIKTRLKLEDKDITRIWSQNQFGLSIDQSLILAMEGEARWMISNGLTTEKTVPNFLNYIYEDALKAVKPEAVKIIR